MGVWVYGGLVAVTMLALTVAVLVKDPLVSERVRWTPAWRVPGPEDLRTADLPTRWFGYDPDRVDAILLTTADALEVAYAELGPDGRARLRAALMDEDPVGVPLAQDPAASAGDGPVRPADDDTVPATGDDATPGESDGIR